MAATAAAIATLDGPGPIQKNGRAGSGGVPRPRAWRRPCAWWGVWVRSPVGVEAATGGCPVRAQRVEERRDGEGLRPTSLSHTHTLPPPLSLPPSPPPPLLPLPPLPRFPSPSLSLSLSLSTRLRVELVQAPHRPADVRLGPDQRPQILGKLRAQVSEQAAGLRQQIPGGP
jgi:hypothetical protein